MSTQDTTVRPYEKTRALMERQLRGNFPPEMAGLSPEDVIELIDDYRALSAENERLAKALMWTRSFLCTHPEYQGGWLDAEEAMNMADAALASRQAGGK